VRFGCGLKRGDDAWLMIVRYAVQRAFDCLLAAASGLMLRKSERNGTDLQSEHRDGRGASRSMGGICHIAPPHRVAVLLSDGEADWAMAGGPQFFARILRSGIFSLRPLANSLAHFRRPCPAFLDWRSHIAVRSHALGLRKPRGCALSFPRFLPDRCRWDGGLDVGLERVPRCSISLGISDSDDSDPSNHFQSADISIADPRVENRELELTSNGSSGFEGR